MNAELQVSTPLGPSGRVFREMAGDYVFRYDGIEPSRCVSLTMPPRRLDYFQRELHPLFQMNLPEGFLLEQLKFRLAKLVKVDPMLLLAISGSNSPVGRVSVSAPEVERLLDQQVPGAKGERLEEILAWDGAQDLFSELVHRYILRSGISGVQPKVLVPELVDTPLKATALTSELIIKSGRDAFPHLAINEYLCMSIASAAGISTPPFYLSKDMKMFVMRRFDRDAELNPLGFEDMAVLMGVGTEQKYSKSYEQIAKAIEVFGAVETQVDSLHRLFDIVALSCIVGNGDAHLKNFGLLYSTPDANDAVLAPAYDIVNTTAYLPDDALALTLNNQKSMFASRLYLLEFGKRCRVEDPGGRICEILQAVEGTLLHQQALVERAPEVALAIRKSAQPFEMTFG
ncbi:type II toxin-antitoxin system HipA family toxin [Pseudomonas juntendi]|uniref:Phosphatidylinositol kinase n=1 Tax=Pseudomonas putida TaxID=303 RepID=A0A1X0ZQW9_PSEPU|nr:type II toxin-antitoxin system HipA family toxin [Pseudomonas putida]EKT4464956.1 type II toxin-antitoxin system HipA family toxin [Pseudomonas putida]EKT4523162.1 type II toxin-antitoxin system HipA family toxin [Pseudomonas putida]ORL61667.1 phosphatidylinositol kinase [Pseudomonas putida]